MQSHIIIVSKREENVAGYFSHDAFIEMWSALLFRRSSFRSAGKFHSAQNKEYKKYKSGIWRKK